MQILFEINWKVPSGNFYFFYNKIEMLKMCFISDEIYCIDYVTYDRMLDVLVLLILVLYSYLYPSTGELIVFVFLVIAFVFLVIVFVNVYLYSYP